MESGMLSKQIENAQKKVEEQNFVMRKNVLKYDDVLNKQRTVIYAQRRQVLEGEDLSEQVREWIREVIERVVTAYTQDAEETDLSALVQAMQDLYATEITEPELREEVGTAREALIDEFVDDALDEYKAKEEEMGDELMRELERFVILQVVDTRWREHLENMDYLREGVHLRSMAQKDPLVEYTAEGHHMFDELGANIREEVVFTLFHAEIAPEDAEALALEGAAGNGGGFAYEHEPLAGADAIAAAGAGEAVALGGGSAVATAPTLAAPGTSVVTGQRVVAEKDKIGRNDPCWCGSGKKYKKCHGA
jgi:preprotein translocase subunit SecA